MRILLGNMKLAEVVEPDCLAEIQAYLDENGYRNESVCDKVEEAEGNYHIYDMPRQIHICGHDKAAQFIAFLQEKDLVKRGFNCRIGVAPLIPTSVSAQ